jgi:hypothetical protein
MEKEAQEHQNVWVMPDDFLGPSFFEEEVATDLEASKDGHKYKAEIDAFWKRQDLLITAEGHKQK